MNEIMKTESNNLSSVRLERIREQGYTCQSDQEINNLAFGNRFAYRLCLSVLDLGVAFANIQILAVMMAVAFFGVVLPNHPFDYIYNHVFAGKRNRIKLPRRSPQLKFACAMATVFIAVTIYFFSAQLMVAGYITAGVLISVASLVSTIDLCIPSKIYNALFTKGVKTQNAQAS